MKVKYLNEKLEYDFDTDTITVYEGQVAKQTLTYKNEGVPDKSLEILETAEMALGMLSEFPNFITVAWAPIVSQLKAIGWKIVDKNEDFFVTKRYVVKNGGVVEIDGEKGAVRARTKGTPDNPTGNIYYPVEQPPRRMFVGIVRHLDSKADELYATSFIKSVDRSVENHNAKD